MVNRKYDEQIGKLRTEKDGVYRVVYRQERLRPGKVTEQTGRTVGKQKIRLTKKNDEIGR